MFLVYLSNPGHSKIAIMQAEWIRGNNYPDGKNILEFGDDKRHFAFQLGIGVNSFEIEEVEELNARNS